MPRLLSAQGPIDDSIEIAALLDFYNSTSQNGSAPWTASYRWNRELLMSALNPADPLTTAKTFDDFHLIYNPPSSTYSTNDLPGVILNGNKDVQTIALSSETGARGAIPNSITKLTQLENLKIYSYNGSAYNEIKGVLPDLSPLVYLTTLNLSGNDCTGLVDWLGKNGIASNKLTKIDISSYYATSSIRLTILPNASFANLVNLTDVSFDGNQFTTVTPGVNNKISVDFRYLDNLTNLSLTNCNLTSTSFTDFDNTAFDGMAKLETLNLGGNQIRDVPTQIGKLLPVKNLYLTSIGLKSLQPNFSQLTKLEYLDLSSNDLSADTNFYDIIQILKDCPVLNSLSLPNNNFTDLTANFYMLDALRTLNLDLNPIGMYDLTNIQGSKITNLALRACMLTSKLPSALLSLNNLTSLTLSNSILGGPSNSPQRNWLDLSNKNIENFLKSLQHLTSLDMSWYSIAGPAALPNWFGTGYMNTIEDLSLDYNQIQLPLPAGLASMSNLKTLNMQNNLLAGVFGNFDCASFPKLTYLDLSYNQLTLPLPALGSCNLLETLNISYNLFNGDLPAYFQSGMAALQSLYINNNNFVSIPNFANRFNKMGFYVSLTYNNLDFGDLDPLYNGSCSRLIGGLSYYPQLTPQPKKGDPITFSIPEGLPITLQFQAPGSNNYYEWEKLTGSSYTLFGPAFSLKPPFATNDKQLIAKVSATDGGIYFTKIRNRCLPDLEFTGNDVQLIIVPPLCQTEIPNKPGTFKLDKLTGGIVFERNDCPTRIPISCAFGPVSTIDNVVSAKATTHTDDWSYTFLNLAPATNPFETGERGKWRPKASYVQRASLVQANDKNYNAGTYRFKAFNYQYGDKSNYPGWLKVNQIEKYSQHGEPVEELNAFNIPSAAKFGYKESFPFLVAQNATYQSVLFESFENVYTGGKFEDGFTANGGAVESGAGNFHSGKNSFKLAGTSQVAIRQFSLNDQIKSKGMQIKVWVKGAIANTLEAQVYNSSDAPLGAYPFTWVANSGEWSLYESGLIPSVFSTLSDCASGCLQCAGVCSPGSQFTIKLNYTGTSVLYIDDLRIQPKDAEMTAYVYDANTLRLLTVFDDQHFGLYYQYNAEGKLIRKMIETERGLKTIQETQYNSQKISKN